MNTKIGTLIKNYREQANITSKELADKIGVSQGTVSNIENGKIGRRTSSLELVRKLIEVLNIPIDDDIKNYLNIDSISDEPNANLQNKMVQVGSVCGHVSEVIIQAKTTIKESFNISNDLDEKELTDIQIGYLIESPIILKTISDYISDNNDEIKKLIHENIKKYYEEIMSSYNLMLK